jgi:O-antigen/teichoic acid export membrane protein
MWVSIKTLLLRQTSVRLNLSANLTGKFLGAVVSLACVPIYIRILGVSGYGVIGIWATLETLAKLLDFGLSPTMTRELAANVRGAAAAQQVRDLVRTVEVLFWSLGLLIGAAIVLSAPLIAANWLQSSQLSPGELTNFLRLIGLLILCRWPLSFYSSGLIGLERQVLQSWTELVFTLARNIGAVFVLACVSPTIHAFLIWQIIVNIANSGTAAVLLWRSLPSGQVARVRPRLLLRVWRFAGGVTAIALVTVLLTDLDKLVVSGLLSLEDFGYYTLASRMAATLYMPQTSVFAAIYPAFVRLAAEKDELRLAKLYHQGSQVISILIFPAATTAAFFAKPLIFAWTGSGHVADETAPIAALLIMGTAFLCSQSLPFALQLANGWTSLSFWTNLIYVPMTTVLLVVLTKHFGGEGAAAVWLMVGFSFYATAIPLMHRRLLRSDARQWYVQDIGMPLVGCSLAAGLLVMAIEPPTTRMGAVLTVALAGVLVGAVGLLATPLARHQVRNLWKYRAGTINTST